jgi:molybdopterin/thiamine biosynthesis adenylyltransferase
LSGVEYLLGPNLLPHEFPMHPPKVIAAKKHLEAIRHDIVINAYVSHVDAYFLDTYISMVYIFDMQYH